MGFYSKVFLGGIVMKKSTSKKILVALLSFVMVFAMAACGGGGGDESSTDVEGGFTIFNSKSEIQGAFEDLAKQYTEETGVPVEVYMSQDTVAAHLATKYASKDPYTLNMVDPKDIYSLGVQYGLDMSDMDWVSDTNEAIEVDGKVLGYPTCIEGRGIIYNGTAIKNITGKDFDPASIKTLDDFKAICEELKKGGMEAPVGILKEDWSLAAHYLAQAIEEREDVDGYVASLKAGEAKIIDDPKFNALMDTFDVLMKYNAFAAGPTSVEREQVEQMLSEGQIAFMFGGNWDFALMKDFDYTGGAGMMAVPQKEEDAYTGKLLGGGSKYFYIDASENTTPEEQQMAKDFLEWLRTSEAGQTFISDTCGMVSPFGSNTVPVNDDLGAAIKTYADADMLIPNYLYFPDDHISVMGAKMQEYLAGACTREDLASAYDAYWQANK
jgi:raffinose/stachyose/melibiose transport system substrate-binding protein